MRFAKSQLPFSFHVTSSCQLSCMLPSCAPSDPTHSCPTREGERWVARPQSPTFTRLKDLESPQAAVLENMVVKTCLADGPGAAHTADSRKNSFTAGSILKNDSGIKAVSNRENTTSP